MDNAHIPIIDLGGLVGGAPGGLEQAAQKIGEAARETGFFYLKNHGIDADLITAINVAAHAVFALPDVDKLALTKDFHTTNRGYVPMEGENLDPSKPADLKEAFNVGLELAPDDPRILAGEPFRALNQWPHISGWRDTVLKYFNAVWGLGRTIHRAIALDLKAAPDFFEDKLDAPMATLRLLHYPPQPANAAASQIGAGTHTDYGNITILLPDEVGGLEVRRRDGEWIQAPTVDGTFICNIGDCLMRWTNDVYVSTPHRVVNGSGRERYSIAFFLDPNPDAEVSCLPGCVSADRPPRYAPVSGAEYLWSRLDATYEQAKKGS